MNLSYKHFNAAFMIYLFYSMDERRFDDVCIQGR